MEKEDIFSRIEKDKAELDSYLSNKKKDVAILNQVLEPVKEATEELTEVMSQLVKISNKETVYFDKEFNKKVIDTISKVLQIFQNYKQPDISPLISEIKKGNDNILKILNEPNQSVEVVRMLSAMIGKQNIAFENLKKESDYSPKFDALVTAISNSNKTNEKVEKLTVVYEYGSIKEVIPVYKK